MPKISSRIRQISLMSLLILTLLAGVFATGFRAGYADGEQAGSFADFDELIRLIQTTVVPDNWEQLGGASPMEPVPPVPVVFTLHVQSDITIEGDEENGDSIAQDTATKSADPVDDLESLP